MTMAELMQWMDSRDLVIASVGRKIDVLLVGACWQSFDGSAGRIDLVNL